MASTCNGGGFACVAGSHTSSAAVPESMRDLSKSVHPLVTRVPAAAGDAIIFTEVIFHLVPRLHKTLHKMRAI